MDDKKKTSLQSAPVGDLDRKNIPFSLSSDPNTIVLHRAQLAVKDSAKMEPTKSLKSVILPPVQTKLHNSLLQSSPRKAAASTGHIPGSVVTPKSVHTKLLSSSTRLISTNSFSRCSKKVTDKGITFEIKAESKPKNKRVSDSASVVSSGSASKLPATSFQRTFYVPPGEDVQKATERVVSQITAELNKQAASQLAQGHTPDKETVIEITRIAAPGEGYFSRENVQKISKEPPNIKSLNTADRNVRLLGTSPEKSTQKTPPQTGTPTVSGDRTPSPPSLPEKQEALGALKARSSNTDHDQVRISGSSVQFKTKIHTAPVSMPLISSIGSHCSNAKNKLPLQVIVPQNRGTGTARISTHLNQSKFTPSATIHNGRMHTVIQPVVSADPVKKPSTQDSHPSLDALLAQDPVIKTESATVTEKVKHEVAPSLVSSSAAASHASTTAGKQPPTTVHTITLNGSSLKQDGKGILSMMQILLLRVFLLLLHLITWAHECFFRTNEVR